MLKQIDVCNETSKHHFLKSVKINTTLLSDANVPVRFRAEQRAGIANHSSRPTVLQLYQTDLRIIRHRGHKFPRSLKLLSSQNWKRMASSVDCNRKFSERIFSTPVIFKAKIQGFQLTGLFWWQKTVQFGSTSGRLGEREMLCEHKPQASVSTAFSSSPQLSRVVTR